MEDSAREYDIFLSHASPDKPWVETPVAELEDLGLRVFLDKKEIRAGDNWLMRLSDALQNSHYMVLVLSDKTADCAWVIQEWTSFIANHGPLGRLLPMTIDAVDLPPILKATQTIDATGRDAVRAAAELSAVIGDLSTVPPDDERRRVLRLDLVFPLSRASRELVVVPPSAPPLDRGQGVRGGPSRILAVAPETLAGSRRPRGPFSACSNSG